MSSVSRVLNGHPDVSEHVRNVVNTAVDELGYRPDVLAQGLRLRKTLSVGFTVSDIGNPVLASAVTVPSGGCAGRATRSRSRTPRASPSSTPRTSACSGSGESTA